VQGLICRCLCLSPRLHAGLNATRIRLERGYRWSNTLAGSAALSAWPCSGRHPVLQRTQLAYIVCRAPASSGGNSSKPRNILHSLQYTETDGSGGWHSYAALRQTHSALMHATSVNTMLSSAVQLHPSGCSYRWGPPQVISDCPAPRQGASAITMTQGCPHAAPCRLASLLRCSSAMVPWLMAANLWALVWGHPCWWHL
jgi:hypothetical protein